MSKNFNQLRILHLGDMAFVGYKLTKLLRKNGIFADYLYYNDSFYDFQKKEPWHYSFKTSQSDKFNKIKVIKESLQAIEKYDIIHAHSIYALPLLFCNKKIVLHLHGTDIRKYAKEKTPLGVGMSAIIKRADSILVSTPDLLKEVQIFGRSATFMPNPIDFDIFRPWKTDLDLHKGRDFVIFHPSHHSLTKKNDVLIRAFSEVLKSGFNAKLVMIEWGSLLEESKKLVSKLGITENVEWMPRIQPSRMVDYYNASDIVCDQFMIGGLGQISLEAMACGRAVVTKCDLHDMKQGYSSMPPINSCNNEAQIAVELIRLLKNKKDREKMEKISVEWVKHEHSPQRIISLLRKCYLDIIT